MSSDPTVAEPAVAGFEPMRVSTMRAVDRWLGVPLCLLLTLVCGPWIRWRRRRETISPPRSIAFIKLAEQGTTVLAVAAIRRAVALVGQDNVYFVTFEANRPIVDVIGLIPPDNVLTIRDHSLRDVVSGTWRVIRRLRHLRVEASIDMEFFARSSALLAFLAGLPRRVGYHCFEGEGPYRGDLMTYRLRYNPHHHISVAYALMVEALLEPPTALPTFDLVPPEVTDDPPPRFEPDDDERAAVGDILRLASGSEAFEPLVLLNSNCSDLLPLRQWPSERYVELAHRLLETHTGLSVAFTGAPAEAEAVGLLVDAVGSPRCFSIAGKTTLRQLIVAYGMAEILVTNDSGPAHFASVTPIDVVTLFGPETPELFAARSPRNHVIWAGLACSPCVSALNNRVSHCRDNVCMQHISVEAIFQRVCAILAHRGHGPPVKSATPSMPPPALE